MTTKLWVAIYKENTQKNQRDDLPGRKDKLERAVKDAYAQINLLGSSPDPVLPTFLVRPFALFAAPEYLFAEPITTGTWDDHQDGMQRQVDEWAKAEIEKFIKDLSKSHPGMILIPGSVAWYKTFNRDWDTYLKRRKLLDDPSRSEWMERLGVYKWDFDRKTRTRQEKAIADLEAKAKRLPWGAGPKRTPNGPCSEVFICHTCLTFDFDPSAPCGKCGGTMVPEIWRFCLACGLPIEEFPADSVQDCPDCGRKLFVKDVTHTEAVATVPTALNLARNTVYVYLNGERRAKYHKQAGFHEVLNDRGETVFVPGKKQPTFAIDGIWYGLEVCLDHGAGALKTPQDIFSPVKPDIHIILSAQIEAEFDNRYVRKGGWVVHASSYPKYNKVYKVGDSDWTKQPVQATAGDVDIYQIEV
jgi:DNA-directed RNA polymerase subunit RPC12/RpoP